MQEEKTTPPVARATDKNWSDGQFHDRALLYRAPEDVLYLLEGRILPGNDPNGQWHEVIAGIAREDRENHIMTVLSRDANGKWVRVGQGRVIDSEHLLFSVRLGGVDYEWRARFMGGTDEYLCSKLGTDSVEKLDLDIKSPAERRSMMRAVS